MARKTPARIRRENAFFGLHFDLHPGASDTQLGAQVTPAMVARIIRAARPDYIQYDCKGHVGYLGYPGSKVSASAGGPEGKGIINDSLAIYRKATAAAGVALLVHFSGVWDRVACTDHPEWGAIDAQGKPDANNTSTFGPYVVERMIPQMKEIVDRYGVDGFWVDGDCWATQVDYCPAAREAFKAATGQENPPTAPGQPYWYEWMTIQRDQFFRYAKTYMDAIHAYCPSVQVASNWLYSPLAPEPVRMPVDFISGDYAHSDSVNSARFNGRQMAGTGLPWDLMAWAFSLTNKGPHTYKSAAQLQQEAAAVLALGGGFQIYFHPDRHGGFPAWQIDLMAQAASFCRERQEVSHKTQPVPQVALLLDTNTLFRTMAKVYAPWAGEYNPLQGMLHAILEAGHSADILGDHQLPSQQDRWPVVVVPEWDQLPPGLVHALVEYVRRGGSLLLTGAKTCGLFREHLGVEFVGEPKEEDAHLLVEPRMTPGLSWEVPVKGLWQEVRAAGAGKARPTVLADRSSDRMGVSDRKPAATLTRLGRGRIAAVYGPLGSAHFSQHSFALREWVGSLLNKLYEPKVTIDYRDNPHAIDLAVREKDGRLIIHLNNVSAMPVSNDRYHLIDRVPSLGPLGLEVRLSGKPRRVTLEPGGKALKTTWRDGVLRVEVPGVGIHAAVVVA